MVRIALAVTILRPFGGSNGPRTKYAGQKWTCSPRFIFVGLLFILQYIVKSHIIEIS